jgi:hypothetical protein
MFPFLTLGFPFSYVSLVLGFILGIGLTIATVSFFASSILLICIYTGILRIKPLLQTVHRFLHVFFPSQEKQVQQTVRQMFHVKGGEQIKQPAIVLFHPHGAFSVSYFFHTMTNLTNWPLQKGKACVLRYLYWLPFGQEILDELGCVPNRYVDMKEVLEGGSSLYVIPGGIREMYDSQLKIKILQRKGVFRLALESGTPLVPVLTYGENDLYELLKTPYFKKLQDWLAKWDLILPIPSLNSLKKWFLLISGQLNHSLETVIGDPIEVQQMKQPSEEDIQALQTKYIVALQELYQKTKPVGYEEKLIIV